MNVKPKFCLLALLAIMSFCVAIPSFAQGIWKHHDSIEVNGKLRKVAVDHENRTWILSYNEVGVYDGTQFVRMLDSDSIILGGVFIALEIAPDGAVWVGSSEVAARYDGENWTVFNSSNSALSKNGVSDIAIDSKGGAWFTLMITAYYFDGSEWTVYKAPEADFKKNLLCVTVDGDDNVWFGTAKNGVLRYDGSTWRTYGRTNSGLDGFWVPEIQQGPDGKIYMGHTRGISIYDGQSWNSYSKGEVISIEHSSNGYIWIADGHGFSSLNGEYWSDFKSYDTIIGSKNEIYDLAIDHDDTIWIVAEKGVYSLKQAFLQMNKPENDMTFEEDAAIDISWSSLNSGPLTIQYSEVYPYSWKTLVSNVDPETESLKLHLPPGILPQGQFSYRIRIRLISTIDPDLSCEISITIQRKGIDDSIETFDGDSVNLPSDFYKMYENRSGVLWVCTGFGVARYDGSLWRKHLTHDSLLPSNVIFDVTEDITGAMWFATKGGISRLENGSWETWNASQHIPFIAADNDGNVWAVIRQMIYAEDNTENTSKVYDKLYRFNGSSFQHEAIAYEDSLFGVSALAVSPTGELWLSGDSRLYRKDDSGWDVFTFEEFLLHDEEQPVNPTSLAWNPDGDLWMCSKGISNSLYSFDGREWKRETALLDGLPRNTLKSIAFDSAGKLWCVTSQGFHVRENTTWRSYSSDNRFPYHTIEDFLIDRLDNKWLFHDGVISRFDDTLVLVDEQPQPSPLMMSSFPNPFNAMTTITFSLPARSNAELKIYSINGQKIRTLVAGDMPGGKHSVVWNARSESEAAVSTGMYFVRLLSENTVVTEKILLIK